MLGSSSLEGRLPASLLRGSPHQVDSSPSACTFEPHLQGSYLQGQNWAGLDCTLSLALRAWLRTESVRGIGSEAVTAGGSHISGVA